jgi:hypothetical protein
MKAYKIKLAREKLTSRKFLEKRLLKIAYKLLYLENFEKFECSSFFKGELLAELNFKTYLSEKKKWERLADRTKELLARVVD